MPRPPTPIILTDEERSRLDSWTKQQTIENRMAVRARIILLADQGLNNEEIAERVGMHPVKISKWRTRFAANRIAGLDDKERSGRPLVYDHNDRMEVIKKACQSPKPNSNWSVRDLEKILKEKVGMSKSQINEILRKVDLKPHLMEMWMNSKDPEFEAKQIDVIGLYLNPPENALVVSVDEKTQMQTNTPIAPDKPAIPGSNLKRENHYKRKGVQCLFAALLVHEGKIIADIQQAHKHQEFLDFLKLIHRRTPSNLDLHIIADNYGTHKHDEVNEWIKKHPRVHMHFTPTHASWLNQIELWFSILSRKLLKRGFFKSQEDQAKQIIGFIKKYNLDAKPFAWTYTGKPLTI